MNWTGLGRMAAGALVALGLAGCVDADIDIAVTSDSTAQVVMTQQMGADFYSMVKTGAKNGEGSEEGFCDDGTLTENADGSATCVVTEEGAFADLSLAKDDNGLKITPAGNGLVRVALPTDELKSEVGAEEAMDEDTKQMVETFFAGHSITITISGGEIVDTNMDPTEDGEGVETVIPLLDLIKGTLDLPKELYAVVRAP